MKRKNIIIVMLLLLSGIVTMQSCKKDEQPTPVVYKAAVPANPKPAVDGVVLLAGTSYTITWEGSATSWDVYFGPDGFDTLVKAGVNGKSLTVTAPSGGEYFWHVKTKDANGVVSTSPTWNFYINSAPTVPVLAAPANEAVDFGVTGALKFSSTDAEEDAITYDVYIGATDTTLALVAANVADETYSPTMTASTKYYWKVVANDSHGATATSAIWSFTTGLEPIMTFTGLYLADEPAEAYTYDVSFTKASATTIKTTNYWNSGWTATFTLDLVNNSFIMTSYTFSAGWTGVESGVIDPATGTMTGYYALWKGGVLQEEGVHTYTKK